MRGGGAWRGRAGRDADKSKGPISIPGPIFTVRDRTEDPDLRTAERSWWPLVEGRRSRKKKNAWGSSSFFELRKWKMPRDSSFFGPRGKQMGGYSFFISDWEDRRNPLSSKNPRPSSNKSHLPSSVRSSTHSSELKIEDGGVSSTEGSSNMGEERFFEEPSIFEEPLHLRRTPHLRSSTTKIEEPPHTRSLEPKIGSKIAIGSVVTDKSVRLGNNRISYPSRHQKNLF